MAFKAVQKLVKVWKQVMSQTKKKNIEPMERHPYFSRRMKAGYIRPDWLNATSLEVALKLLPTNLP